MFKCWFKNEKLSNKEKDEILSKIVDRNIKEIRDLIILLVLTNENYYYNNYLVNNIISILKDENKTELKDLIKYHFSFEIDDKKFKKIKNFENWILKFVLWKNNKNMIFEHNTLKNISNLIIIDIKFDN